MKLRPHGINWARVNKASAVPLFKRLRRDCDLFITASTNDTCCSLAASNNLSLSQFLLFNPTVDCDNLNSTSVCVTLKLQGEVREKRSGFRRRYHRRYGGYNTANQGYGIGDYGGQGDYGTSDYGSDYYDDYY